MIESEPRYEIVEAGGRLFLLDLFTGKTMVMMAANSASPRWKAVAVDSSTAKEAKEDS